MLNHYDYYIKRYHFHQDKNEEALCLIRLKGFNRYWYQVWTVTDYSALPTYAKRKFELVAFTTSYGSRVILEDR